jgi:hypothetical protein
MAQWHVKVATSAGLVEGAGTSYVERKTISDPVHNHTHFFPNKNNLLTCAKRQDRRIGGTEQAKIDTWELKTSFSSGLRGSLFARRRCHDAVDVQRVAQVLTVLYAIALSIKARFKVAYS